MSTTYPMGYGTQRGTLDEMMAELNVHGHPEYIRRIKIWFVNQDGKFGIGDAWRAVQPDKDGFAPPGMSFHQDQTFASGFIGSCAVDLVVGVTGAKHRAPKWSEVPAQGTTAAVKCGLHCNVGTPGVTGSEPWHMQPIEIDGWASWVNAGRKDPIANYGIVVPTPVPPTPTPTPTPGGTVLLYKVEADDSYWKICEKVFEDGRATMTRVGVLQAANPDNPTLNPGELINIPGKIAV